LLDFSLLLFRVLVEHVVVEKTSKIMEETVGIGLEPRGLVVDLLRIAGLVLVAAVEPPRVLAMALPVPPAHPAPFATASALFFSTGHVVAPLGALGGHPAVEAGLAGGLDEAEALLVILVSQPPEVEHLAGHGAVLLSPARETKFGAASAFHHFSGSTHAVVFNCVSTSGGGAKGQVLVAFHVILRVEIHVSFKIFCIC